MIGAVLYSHSLLDMEEKCISIYQCGGKSKTLGELTPEEAIELGKKLIYLGKKASAVTKTLEKFEEELE